MVYILFSVGQRLIQNFEINTEDAKMLIKFLKIFLQVVIKGKNYGA